ncbi:protein kinase domain-containing protein [Streptomyces sp. NBC_00090]|uniref:serine/threonine-protein kinase n=1 Tax=Streptomyces sp. NBC_00090 TaxID=2903619 RepID=UPI00386F932D
MSSHNGPEQADHGLLGGRYRLGERLGQGGMGVVRRATDELLGRAVAVKTLAIDTGADPASALREARVVARIRHPHVIVVHDVVEHEGRPALVMELVDGGSLADRLATPGGVLSPRETARLGLDLLDALSAAHARSVLHRDVKPANVLLEKGTGRAVLTDFGIASLPGATTLSGTGVFVGTPEYTAPERMEGGDAGPASDLWSLGALLCAAATGASPFRRDSLGAVLHAIVYEEIRPPERLGPLVPVVRGLLERDPDRRLGAAEARRMLAACVTGETPAAGPVPPPPAPGAYTPTSREPSPSAAPPEADTPRADTPRADTPRADTPRADTPWAAAPEADTPRSDTPWAATPEAAAPRPAAPDDVRDALPARPGKGARRRSGLVLPFVAAAVAACVGAVTAAVLIAGRDEPSTGAGPAGPGSRTAGAAPTAPPTGSAPPAPAPGPVPDGYTAVDDERGFTLAVPAGARRSTDGERVFYTTADGAVWVGIRIRAVPSGGAIGAMRTADASGPRNNPGYRDAVVEETRHKGLPAARWEFTWNGFTSAEGPRRTVDLCWEQAGTLYDVWVSAPEGRAGEARGHFAAALDSFRTSGRSSGGSTGD